MYHELVGTGLCNGKNPLAAGCGERERWSAMHPIEADKELKKHTPSTCWCHGGTIVLKTRAGTNVDSDGLLEYLNMAVTYVGMTPEIFVARIGLLALDSLSEAPSIRANTPVKLINQQCSTTKQSSKQLVPVHQRPVGTLDTRAATLVRSLAGTDVRS